MGAASCEVILFNTAGHAAERRSDGSNVRIKRGMNAGKRCSTALADPFDGLLDLPSSQIVHGETDGPQYASSRRPTSRGSALSACPSFASAAAITPMLYGHQGAPVSDSIS
jgi:hypothetical protein